MPHQTNTGIPYTVRVWVNRCDYIEQVLDIHILRRDPLCFLVARLVRINRSCQPAEVTALGRIEEWGRIEIFWTKVISEWCQHCDESITSVCQGENAEFVEDVCSVGDGG